MTAQEESRNPLFLQLDCVNPYREAAHLVLNRMRWDLHPAAWKSRSKLTRIRNEHDGKSAVILCNGPSLLKTDLSLLEGTFTFGLNKINLLFESHPFRPSSIVSVNPHVIEQNLPFFNSTDIPLFVDSRAVTELGLHFRENVHALHSARIRRFARDCSWSLYQGHTVTFVALQLAFHMGFSRVALVGCDHYFSTPGPANALVESRSDDPNHFHPDYFGKGMKWQLPDLFESEVAYTMAKNMYAAFNREVVNCTSGGALEIFRRDSLADFLAGK